MPCTANVDVVGESVEGIIYVEALDAIPLEKIYVKVKGKEKVKWEEHWTESIYEGQGEQRRLVREEHHSHECDEDDKFFKAKIRLGSAGILPAGLHAFPFQFFLPTHSHRGAPLPGSFAYKDGFAGTQNGRQIRDLKAKVEYSTYLLTRSVHLDM